MDAVLVQASGGRLHCLEGSTNLEVTQVGNQEEFLFVQFHVRNVGFVTCLVFVLNLNCLNECSLVLSVKVVVDFSFCEDSSV